MFRSNILNNLPTCPKSDEIAKSCVIRNPPPPAPECLDRLEALKITEIVTAKKCVDEHFENKEMKNHATYGRINADSKSESHKEVLRLDAEKRKLINESYVKMKAGGVNNILMVFIRMFAENPQYKNIWAQFRAIPDSSLISSDQLRNHAKVYLGGMNALVEHTNLGEEKEFINLIRRMARSHAKFGVHKYHLMNMLPEYIAVLETAGVDVTPEIREAWTTLFDVIGNLLRMRQ